MPATEQKKAECRKHSAARAYARDTVLALLLSFVFFFLSFFAANSAATA